VQPPSAGPDPLDMITGGAYVQPLPVIISLSFDRDMDETALPLITDFAVTVGGTPKPVGAVSWFGVRTLYIELQLPSAPGPVNVVYTAGVNRILSLDGLYYQTNKTVNGIAP